MAAYRWYATCTMAIRKSSRSNVDTPDLLSTLRASACSDVTTEVKISSTCVHEADHQAVVRVMRGKHRVAK